MQRIFLVEDDPTIARLVAGELENWGYEVARPSNFSAVMEEFRRFAPHLVVLDLSLPHRSGFHWCGEMRRESTLPILFLSSSSASVNQLTALHQGADDFMAKPFDMPVLVAKVQALLRRSYEFAAPAQPPACQGAQLDCEGMTLAYAGRKIPLTRNEFRILQLLLEKPGRVVGRDVIMRRLWEDESFIDDNTLTVNVNRLRKKLESEGLPGFICTKKGEGYWAAEEGESE